MVPVDFSDCSLAGLSYAIQIAKEVGAHIIVLHVADLGPVMMTSGPNEYRFADLIVISSHGRTGLRRALIGSVAEGTVRNAACPVLVVPSFARMRKN